jgi:type I restriction-modification system DNA methylase subunit
MADLKSTLQALVADAQKAGFYDLAEMQVQSDYVLKVLEALGWESRDWKLGQSQEVDTGKMPDIVLHDKNGYAVFVMDCKDASGPRKLDGSYFSGKARKSFVDKLFDYCEAEGIYWGMLTNFVEWRLYSVQQKRLYLGKKFAIHDLVWPKAEHRDYVDLLSEEGLGFLSLFQRKEFCERKGKVDTDPVYYPQEEEIKEQFFARLRAWRGLLRSELFQNYGERFNKQEIDLFTQKILDRVIFMDVCHDKGIIGPDHLRAILHSKGSKYGELKHRFRDMDERFNTELFMLHEIDRFEVSDETLIPILNELILTDFSRISVHIIGEVYENYLGEILRVSKKKGLRVQEHKEQAKRKEHGIYYTPEYIVDYIVKNTLGELLKEVKTEAELRRIRVLDPACGSGSFLIRAFDLFYEAYHGIREKGQLAAFKDFEIKKAILQNNLFGVDLDERAVEIAKLNLMLKALEGVNWPELKGRKLLPNLSLNIRCGNSLISGHRLEEQYEGELALGDRFDREIGELVKLRKQFYKETEDEGKEALLKQIRRDEEVINRKLNANLKGFFKVPEVQRPLNFQVVFPEVFQDGGFDGVIGNPPYVLIQSEFRDNSLLSYYRSNYQSASYKIDTYHLFVERGVRLIKQGGRFSMITPSNYLTNNFLINLRRFLLANSTIKEILVFGKGVFPGASVDNAIVLTTSDPQPSKSFPLIQADVLNNVIIKKEPLKVKCEAVLKDPYCLFTGSGEGKDIWDSVLMKSQKLGDIAHVNFGKQLRDRKVYTSDVISVFSLSELVAPYKPCYTGRDVKRYSLSWNKLACYDHEKARTGGCWDSDKQNAKYKIVTRQIGKYPEFAIDTLGYQCLNTMFMVNVHNAAVHNPYFILGLLNSGLIKNYWLSRFCDKRQTFPKIKGTYLKELPIYQVKTKAERDVSSQIIELVKELLPLARTTELRSKNETKMAALEKEIDGLVYRLYGLTTKEVEAIGGSGS